MKKLLKIVLIALLNFISKTWKFKVFGEINTNPTIIIFWHKYLLSGWKFLSRNGNYYAVVSPSRDGQYLVDLLTKWKLSFIRGSSDKNRKELLAQIVHFAQFNSVSLTPDGPRGPKFKLKPGSVVAAFRANVPIQFVKIKNTKKIKFQKSWDNFEIPLPFSTILINVSAPILVSAKANRDEINSVIQDIEQKMNDEQIN